MKVIDSPLKWFESYNILMKLMNWKLNLYKRCCNISKHNFIITSHPKTFITLSSIHMMFSPPNQSTPQGRAFNYTLARCINSNISMIQTKLSWAKPKTSPLPDNRSITLTSKNNRIVSLCLWTHTHSMPSVCAKPNGTHFSARGALCSERDQKLCLLLPFTPLILLSLARALAPFLLLLHGTSYQLFGQAPFTLRLVCLILFFFVSEWPNYTQNCCLPPSMPGHATHFRSFPNPIKSENWNCCVYVRMSLCVCPCFFSEAFTCRS